MCVLNQSILKSQQGKITSGIQQGLPRPASDSSRVKCSKINIEGKISLYKGSWIIRRVAKIKFSVITTVKNAALITHIHRPKDILTPNVSLEWVKKIYVHQHWW